MPRGVLPVGRPKTKYLQWLWTFVLWSEHYSKLHFHKLTKWDSPIWSGIKVFNPFHYIFGCPFANIFWCIQNHQTHFYNLIIGYLICDKLHPFVWEIFFPSKNRIASNVGQKCWAVCSIFGTRLTILKALFREVMTCTSSIILNQYHLLEN